MHKQNSSFTSSPNTGFEALVDQSNAERKAANQMTLYDKLTLGPLDKYLKYNRFPYKLMLSVALVLMTSFQVLVTVESRTAYSRSQDRLFHKLFLGADGLEDTDRTRIKFLFSAEEAREFMTESVSNYFSMNETTINKV